MDKLLTPNKIENLLSLAAQDRSFVIPTQFQLNEENYARNIASSGLDKSTTNCESSAGILDLENLPAFGESETGIRYSSMSKSCYFNPGEITGRSTGAEEMKIPGTDPSAAAPSKSDIFGRHSLETITSTMDKQSEEVDDVMRHSIATNYTFNYMGNLTADEESRNKGMLSIPTGTFIPDSVASNNSTVSSYFMRRCQDLQKILTKTDSPMKHSITEVSSTSNIGKGFKLDESLDSIPVRQPRPTTTLSKKLESIRETQMDPPMLSKNIHATLNKSIIMPAPLVPAKVPTNGVGYSNVAHGILHKKNLQFAFQSVNEDTNVSENNSINISMIADFLGKDSVANASNMRVSDLLHHIGKKQPLGELQMNAQTLANNEDVQVTYLKDTRNKDTASSTDTASTVLSVETHKKNLVKPNVLITPPSPNVKALETQVTDMKLEQRTSRSKSPSNKSFNSSDNSTLHSSKGQLNSPKIPSPNVAYKELDHSIDWSELMQHPSRQHSLVKEHWADVSTTKINGFVGVRTPVTVSVTTITDSWLTGKFVFDDILNQANYLNIELPRFPILLSPRKLEQFILYLTSNVEIDTSMPYTMTLKDASIDHEIEQKGSLEVNLKMPVMHAVSADGHDKISFPPIQEKTSVTKAFVLISDCPVDLQMVLSIVEGDSMFAIKKLKEVNRNDVNKILLDGQGSTEEPPSLKFRGKVINKHLCRLSKGNAIMVTITFNAPKLSDLSIYESSVTFSGALNVNLIGMNTILKKIELIAIVGCANLEIKMSEEKLEVSKDLTTLDVQNSGIVDGTWVVKYKSATSNSNIPFRRSVSKFELRPGGVKTITLSYTGPMDSLNEGTIIFEDVNTGKATSIQIYGGSSKPKPFPVKTNHQNVSWVRPGRKDLSMKNYSDQKTILRCQIIGEGFSIDLPRLDTRRGVVCFPLEARECRPLPLLFAPNTRTPLKAELHLIIDKNSEHSRKIMLYGCSNDEAVRWSGLVTYGQTALVRAVCGDVIELKLYNKSPVPVFISASLHFNLQYMCLERDTVMEGSNCVVSARTHHSVRVAVPWPLVTSHARYAPHSSSTALASVTVLTGAEITRRRILKVLRDESKGEQLDLSLLPSHLNSLADPFEGEDTNLDSQLTDFKETTASLNELISGLQELTAQIDLPQDFADENTIVITDDSLIEHHTICD